MGAMITTEDSKRSELNLARTSALQHPTLHDIKK